MVAYTVYYVATWARGCERRAPPVDAMLPASLEYSLGCASLILHFSRNTVVVTLWLTLQFHFLQAFISGMYFGKQHLSMRGMVQSAHKAVP